MKKTMRYITNRREVHQPLSGEKLAVFRRLQELLRDDVGSEAVWAELKRHPEWLFIVTEDGSLLWETGLDEERACLLFFSVDANPDLEVVLPLHSLVLLGQEERVLRWLDKIPLGLVFAKDFAGKKCIDLMLLLCSDDVVCRMITKLHDLAGVLLFYLPHDKSEVPSAMMVSIISQCKEKPLSFQALRACLRDDELKLGCLMTEWCRGMLNGIFQHEEAYCLSAVVLFFGFTFVTKVMRGMHSELDEKTKMLEPCRREKYLLSILLHLSEGKELFEVLSYVFPCPAKPVGHGLSRGEEGDKKTLFQLLVAHAGIDVVKEILLSLDRGLGLLMTYGNNRGQNCLHILALDNRVSMLKLLLDIFNIYPNGALTALEKQDKDGQNPMCLALKCGHVDVVRMIMEYLGVEYRFLMPGGGDVFDWTKQRLRHFEDTVDGVLFDQLDRMYCNKPVTGKMREFVKYHKKRAVEVLFKMSNMSLSPPKEKKQTGFFSDNGAQGMSGLYRGILVRVSDFGLFNAFALEQKRISNYMAMKDKAAGMAFNAITSLDL